jgi:hypothetical protein
MKRVLMIAVIVLMSAACGFAEKYPLVMSAIYTKGKSVNLHSGKMYHSGEYECTEGDEHNAPDCRTILEWAQLDSIGGTPDTVLFTLADGSQVGVHSPSVHKIPGYVECNVGTPVVFCDLYFNILGMTQISAFKKGPFNQDVALTTEEYAATQKALNTKLFGNGNQMKVSIPYKLHGKPKNGFQRIDVDGLHNDLSHIINTNADGYYIGSTVKQ